MDMREFIFGEHICCSSVDEYKELPKNKRIIWGFIYKSPSFYKLGEDFNSYFSKNFPIQYRIREFCTRTRYFVKHKFSDLKWKIENFLYPPHPILRKSIPKEWVDLVDLIIDINFAIILQFQDEIENSSCAMDLEFAEWIGKSVEYIKIERPKKFKEIEEIMEGYDVGNCFANISSTHNKTIYNKTEEIKKEIEQKDSEIIKQMIDYRGYFWT
jgi:hypothetical protein